MLVGRGEELLFRFVHFSVRINESDCNFKEVKYVDVISR